MTVSKTELTALRKLQVDFDSYFKLAVKVYRVHNHVDYPSQEEIEQRIEDEKKARRAINISFGKLEQLIYNLLGGKPMMQIPAIPGYQWDVFSEALSSNFRTNSKGECMEMALDSLDRAVGKAEGLVGKTASKNEPVDSERLFDEAFLKKVSDIKIRELCKEFNNVYPTNPNAGALLFRTILLITLQYKLGGKAKDDLSEVLNQSISSNIYNDRHITRVLKNLQGIPKTLLDATHHSKWMLINSGDLTTWTQGLKQILNATFKK